MKGKELESSITFLPFGSHTKSLDFLEVWYTAYNYKSFEIAAFNNSYNDLTVALFYKREIEVIEKLSFIYSFGVMYGYGGKLKDLAGIPFRNTFVFNGDVNPIAGIIFDYRIVKKVSIQLNVSPVVIVYGARFIL